MGPLETLLTYWPRLPLCSGSRHLWGVGVKQINAGLSYVFGIQQSPSIQVVLIAVITSFATYFQWYWDWIVAFGDSAF